MHGHGTGIPFSSLPYSGVTIRKIVSIGQSDRPIKSDDLVADANVDLGPVSNEMGFSVKGQGEGAGSSSRK